MNLRELENGEIESCFDTKKFVEVRGKIEREAVFRIYFTTRVKGKKRGNDSGPCLRRKTRATEAALRCDARGE
jgi:hypothetical protein